VNRDQRSDIRDQGAVVRRQGALDSEQAQGSVNSEPLAWDQELVVWPVASVVGAGGAESN
jgi:hypothetical protein